MDKKKLDLLLGAKKKAWSTSLNGIDAYINAGNHTTLTALNTADVTIEFFMRRESHDELTSFFMMGSGATSFTFRADSNVQMRGYVNAVTTGARSNVAYTFDTDWSHWAWQYSNTGDRKVYIYKDGTLVSSVNTVASGDVEDLSGTNLMFGTRIDALGYWLHGSFGWIHISDKIRYSSNFTPPSRFEYPDVDANTVRLFKMNEGTGTAIIDYSANAQNATLVNGTWVKS